MTTSAVCRFYDVVNVPDPSHSAGTMGAQEALNALKAGDATHLGVPGGQAHPEISRRYDMPVVFTTIYELQEYLSAMPGRSKSSPMSPDDDHDRGVRGG